MCQNHRAIANRIAELHNVAGFSIARQGGSALATSGSATSSSSMCCATRAEKSETESAQSGDSKAAEELLPLLYSELRQIAASKMASEAAGHTLQPTALVHEAWLRLAGNQEREWDGRPHFFAAAAEAMRRILIDRARRKRTRRHGGGQVKVDLQEIDIAAPDKEEELLVVNEALTKFENTDKEKAELVKLRYFAGLTLEEAARTLSISIPTASRWWVYSRAWLAREIEAHRKA